MLAASIDCRLIAEILERSNSESGKNFRNLFGFVTKNSRTMLEKTMSHYAPKLRSDLIGKQFIYLEHGFMEILGKTVASLLLTRSLVRDG